MTVSIGIIFSNLPKLVGFDLDSLDKSLFKGKNLKLCTLGHLDFEVLVVAG